MVEAQAVPAAPAVPALPSAPATPRPTRTEDARLRVRDWLARTGRDGVVLGTPGGVAWITGGMNLPIDRTAGTDLVWAVVTAGSAALITTDIEADRIRDEMQPAAAGFDLLAVPWWRPEAFAAAALDLVDGATDRLATDVDLGDPGTGVSLVTDELVALRLPLGAAEQDLIRALGFDAADALQRALGNWRPGDTDHHVAAEVAAVLESRGADAPVLIVGGDDRLLRYRHPLAVGAPMHRLAMAVVVARRSGLHVAATRFASAGAVPEAMTQSLVDAEHVDAAVLSACVPGATYGGVLTALARGYADVGQPEAWREHYQGGPIGYAQREFELAPGQSDSRWWATRLAAGHAVAWNPSLAGGGKHEDTYLVSASGLEPLTAAPGWPAMSAGASSPITRRPAVLDIDSGAAALGRTP